MTRLSLPNGLGSTRGRLHCAPLPSTPLFRRPAPLAQTPARQRQRRRSHNAQRSAVVVGSSAQAAAAGAAEAPAADLPAVPADFSFASACGRWRVRPVNKANPGELRRVVGLQAEAFFERGPLPALDGMFKQFFAAEVLSEMQKKVRFNPADRYVVLVAEAAEEGAGKGLVGVVEVSYLDEKEVLRSLPGATAFTYVASMAVDPAWQRQGVATALLQAAERVAEVWEEPSPVLHVYQDNQPAVKLYEGSGYGVIYRDAAWWAKLGARPRYLMQKRQAAAGNGGEL